MKFDDWLKFVCEDFTGKILVFSVISPVDSWSRFVGFRPIVARNTFRVSDKSWIEEIWAFTWSVNGFRLSQKKTNCANEVF